MMKCPKICKSNSYFEGWYFKQQNKEEAISFIPAYHRDKSGKPLASLQIITNASSYNLEFPFKMLQVSNQEFLIRLGDNFFSNYGCKINIKIKDLEIQGKLQYHSLTTPAYNIMGPFAWVPFMECRHSVYSLHHNVNGKIIMNGKEMIFDRDTGYIEGDRGHSFPSRYIWTQCNWGDNSIMLSVAEIPLFSCNFTGCIGSLYLKGREYRIATYCGVKVLYVSNIKILLYQGGLLLYAELLESNEKSLKAPHLGNMKRIIHESVASRVRYLCRYKEKLLFDFTSNQGSFESNWNEKK